MNERMQNLVDHCYHRYSEHNIDLEKFTDMIVLECARIGYKTVWNDGIKNEPPAVMPLHVYQEILHHFGVEE